MTITKNSAWVYPEAYDKAMKDAEVAKKDGYIKVPDWFPVPTPGYEYRILGEMFAFMKPKPKLRHILRHKFVPNWWWTWKAKGWFRKWTSRDLTK